MSVLQEAHHIKNTLALIFQQIVRDIYLIHPLWFQLILIKDLSILLEKFYEVEVLVNLVFSIN